MCTDYGRGPKICTRACYLAEPGIRPRPLLAVSRYRARSRTGSHDKPGSQLRLAGKMNSFDVHNNSVTDWCTEFSKEVANDIFIIKVFFGSLGVLMSLIVIIMIGATKVYKQFVYRLVAYLMIVNVLQALCQVLELFPVEVTEDQHITIRNGTAWKDICEVLGYLDIVTSWSGNFVIIWTMLFMLNLSWKIHRHQETNAQNQKFSRQPKYKLYEVLGVTFVLVCPFLFSWIPFVKDMYGVSGLWCWIRTVRKNGCGDGPFQQSSIILMMVMFYGPLIGILAFGLLCMFAVILLLWRSSRHFHGGNRQKYRSSIKEIGMVLVYPIVYLIFCSLLVMNRIYNFSVHTIPYYPLWMVLAFADAGRIVIPAAAFLLHPHVWKKVISTCRSSSTLETTGYSVPPEDEDISEGISIRPSSSNYGTIEEFLK